MLINALFYFQMVQAIQVLRFHLLELEKVSIFHLIKYTIKYTKTIQVTFVEYVTGFLQVI